MWEGFRKGKRVRVEKEEGVGKRTREGLALGKRWKGKREKVW